MGRYGLACHRGATRTRVHDRACAERSGSLATDLAVRKEIAGMNWIRLALFGIIAGAAIGAALRWPGDIAANAIIPLTLIAVYLVWVFRR